MPTNEMEEITKEARWAVIWLRRLNLRKKPSRSYDSRGPDGTIKPTIKTLAEQLREAQSTPLSIPDCSNVLSILAFISNSQRLSTIEVLKNPSCAKKFFQKLSRSPPPNTSAPDFTTASLKAADNSPPPICSIKKTADKRNAINGAQRDAPPDLEELERRIEQLAQDLEKAYAHQKCTKCDAEIIEKRPPTPPPATRNRPSPLKDRVSFYACILPQWPY
jgi:hypothetical protein